MIEQHREVTEQHRGSAPPGGARLGAVRVPAGSVELLGDVRPEVAAALEDLVDPRRWIDPTAGSVEVDVGDLATDDAVSAVLDRVDEVTLAASRTGRVWRMRAGAVGIDGAGVLLVGDDAPVDEVIDAAVGQGAHHVSSRQVFQVPGSRTVVGYPEPLRGDDGWLPRSRRGPVAHHVRVGSVVFLRSVVGDTSGGAAEALTWLAPAPACGRLLCQVDAPAHDAVVDVASLLAGSGVWQLTYQDPDDAASLLAELRVPLRRHLVVVNELPGGRTLRIGEGGVRVTPAGSPVVLDAAALAAAAPAGRPRPGTADPTLRLGLPGPAVDEVDELPPVGPGLATTAVEGRCTGVLVHQLAAGRPAVDGVEEQLRTRHTAAQSTCAVLERELARVTRLLEEVAAPPLVLKGPVSAHDSLLPPHLRDYGDIDLLVRPEHVDAAVEALIGAGFERRFSRLSEDFDRRFAKSVTLSGPMSGEWPGARPSFELDLHRTLTPGPFGVTLPLDELHERAIPVQLDGAWYRALHPEHRFLHTCLHVALGGSSPRISSVRDLVVCAPWPSVSIASVLELAQRWKIDAAVGRAVDQAEAAFPGALPPRLVAEVRQTRVPHRQRWFLSTYHHRNRSYSLPAAATLVALSNWADRRDFAVAHLRSRRHRHQHHND